MGNLLILFATAAALLLGGCGSNVEDSAGTPISAVELADRIQAGSPPLVLDVRNREEYARGHIPGAINIPHDELPTRLAELPIAKSEEVVVYCYGGLRSQQAEETLRGSGYSNVRLLAGYWKEWQMMAGAPTTE
jgi:phage shock protein E